MHGDLGALARRAGRSIDIIGDADAAALAALARLGAPRRETCPVAELERPLHDLVIGAAVVDHAERVGVRQLGFGHQVAAAQFDAVEAALARGEIDQPLHDEHDFGAARSCGRGGSARCC